MLYKIRCNPVHPLNGALSGPYVQYHMCSTWTICPYAVLWSHIGTLIHRLAAEPRCTAGLLFPSRCPSGTILLTPYSMVWDWRISRAEPMRFYWPKLLYTYHNLLLFFPFFSSVYRLVLWGWGLRTVGMYITLSQLCTANLF